MNRDNFTMILTMPFREIRPVLYLPFQRIKNKNPTFFIIIYLLRVHIKEAFSDILAILSLPVEI